MKPFAAALLLCFASMSSFPAQSQTLYIPPNYTFHDSTPSSNSWVPSGTAKIRGEVELFVDKAMPSTFTVQGSITKEAVIPPGFENGFWVPEIQLLVAFDVSTSMTVSDIIAMGRSSKPPGKPFWCNRHLGAMLVCIAVLDITYEGIGWLSDQIFGGPRDSDCAESVANDHAAAAAQCFNMRRQEAADACGTSGGNQEAQQECVRSIMSRPMSFTTDWMGCAGALSGC